MLLKEEYCVHVGMRGTVLFVFNYCCLIITNRLTKYKMGKKNFTYSFNVILKQAFERIYFYTVIIDSPIKLKSFKIA